MQMRLSQSLGALHASFEAPLLHDPTKESSGKMHERPLAQSALSLQEAPGVPPWQLRRPSEETATQLEPRQSPSSRQGAPGAPELQSPESLAAARTQRPPLQ